jgi:hypothetical protein
MTLLAWRSIEGPWHSELIRDKVNVFEIKNTTIVIIQSIKKLYLYSETVIKFVQGTME